MCQHEFSRPRDPHGNLMSDVYDAPAWREFMGPAVHPNNRIGNIYIHVTTTCTIVNTTSHNIRVGLQVCVDGIPAFSSRTKSLEPVQFVNLSLPPGVRYKLENMILYMLLPEGVGNGAKKYYDWAATYELNDLFHNGMYNRLGWRLRVGG